MKSLDLKSLSDKAILLHIDRNEKKVRLFLSLNIKRYIGVFFQGGSEFGVLPDLFFISGLDPVSDADPRSFQRVDRIHVNLRSIYINHSVKRWILTEGPWFKLTESTLLLRAFYNLRQLLSLNLLFLYRCAGEI